MKMLGIVGGTAPASTVEYYRLIVASYRDRVRNGSYPSLLINCIDLKKMLDLIEAGQLTELTSFLLDEIGKLARAGAEFALLASNTPHIVFDDLARRSPIPLISLVEAACDAVQGLRLERVGLIGTRFTMQGRFYPDIFSRRGIALSVPPPEDQAYIHGKYMRELVNGIFRPDVRQELLAIVDRMKEKDNIQGVVLGGTELLIALGSQVHQSIPFLDTTRIHVERAVTRMLS